MCFIVERVLISIVRGRKKGKQLSFYEIDINILSVHFMRFGEKIVHLHISAESAKAVR